MLCVTKQFTYEATVLKTKKTAPNRASLMYQGCARLQIKPTAKSAKNGNMSSDFRLTFW